MMTGLLAAGDQARRSSASRRCATCSARSKFGVVAGCLVIEGYVKRNNPIRVLRDNVVIFEGALESLRRFKDDVNEVRAGTECGIGVKQLQGRPASATRSSASSAIEVARKRRVTMANESSRKDKDRSRDPAGAVNELLSQRGQGPAR